MDCEELGEVSQHTTKKGLFMSIVKCIASIFLVISISMGVTINIQGGIARSTLDIDIGKSFFSSYSSAPKPGPLFLIGGDYLHRGAFNLSSNIGVLRKPVKGAYNFFKGNLNFEEGLTYLTINSAVEYTFDRWNRIKPFLSVGPRLDIIVQNDPFFDQLPQFNKYALGLNCGGGIKYLIDPLVVGVRFDSYQNFTGIAKWDENENYDRGEIEDITNVFSLVLGYML